MRSDLLENFKLIWWSCNFWTATGRYVTVFDKDRLGHYKTNNQVLVADTQDVSINTVNVINKYWFKEQCPENHAKNHCSKLLRKIIVVISTVAVISYNAQPYRYNTTLKELPDTAVPALYIL